MAAIWKGSIAFGLVNIPVELRTAVRADHISFLEIMRFSNELVDAGEYTFPSSDKVRHQELEMAEKLIDSLAESFDSSRYTDDYRANLMKLIKAKMKGKKITYEEPAEEPDSGVIDLMSRLRESLEKGKGSRGKKSATEKAEKPESGSRKSAGRSRKTKTA